MISFNNVCHYDLRELGGLVYVAVFTEARTP